VSSPITSTSAPSTTPTTGSTTGSSTSSSSTSPLLGSTAPAFTISGLASGLDTASLINAQIAADSAPMQENIQQESVDTQKQAAWNDIQTQMNALQTAIQTLQGASAAAGRVGTVTPPAGQTAVPFTVTATPNAALGTFTVNVQSLATTGSLVSGNVVSMPITGAAALSTPLASLGLGTGVTAGTVTVNGQVITIDSGTTLLGLGAGVDSLQQKLQSAGINLTTTGGSNVTGITLTSTATNQPLQLGAPSDTSNILTALRLSTASQTQNGGGYYAISSNGSLNGINLATPLGSDPFATALTGTSGSFSINGVTINYGPTDTLGSVIGNINSSAAGVTATYDPLSDKVTLTSNTTGSGGIVASDISGNLAAALNLTSATNAVSTPGLPAKLSISNVDGGATIYSASNTVTGLEPGMTLNLTSTSSGGPSTVTVSADTTALTNALQGFVTAYNKVQDTIAQYSAITLDQSGNPQGGVLAGDSSLGDLAQQLDQTVNDTTVTIGNNQYSLANLGISTGAVGSFVPGQAPSLDLQFDSSQVATALASTPTLAQAFIGNGSVSSQNGTLFQNLNTVVNTWTSPLGVIGTALDAISADYADQQSQVQNWQDLIQQQRTQLTDMYTNMETTLASLQAQSQALYAALGISTGSSGSTGSTGSSGNSGTSGTSGTSSSTGG
jgi:flagellar hook-associated protein 2